MQLAWFIQSGLPVSLALIMFSIGLKLQVRELLNILRFPRTFAIGLAVQMFLAPLLTGLVLSFYGASVAYIDFPVPLTILQLVTVTRLPMLLAMLCR